MKKYGYARVSMPSQSLDLQLDSLKKAECDFIFSEKISSRKKDRPRLKELLKLLQNGDTIVCYKLDRLGRSLLELLNLMRRFEEQEIRFISICDGIDTARLGSKLLLNIMMCIADFEREMIRERTIAGLESAKRRGVKLGRPKGLSDLAKKRKTEVLGLYEDGVNPTEISKKIDISRPTVYRYIRMQ